MAKETKIPLSALYFDFQKELRFNFERFSNRGCPLYKYATGLVDRSYMMNGGEYYHLSDQFEQFRDTPLTKNQVAGIFDDVRQMTRFNSIASAIQEERNESLQRIDAKQFEIVKSLGELKLCFGSCQQIETGMLTNLQQLNKVMENFCTRFTAEQNAKAGKLWTASVNGEKAGKPVAVSNDDKHLANMNRGIDSLVQCTKAIQNQLTYMRNDMQESNNLLKRISNDISYNLMEQTGILRRIETGFKETKRIPEDHSETYANDEESEQNNFDQVSQVIDEIKHLAID